jgi:6-phosphogluconolactonase
MKRKAMAKISIKKYQNEKKFWKDIATATVKELNAAVTQRVLERGEVGLETGGETFGLAFLGLSGGKTPTPLYRLLGEDKKVNWARTNVYLIDERMVPRNDDKSNSRMIRESLYAGANEINLAFFHDFMTELPIDETLNQYREEFLLVPEEQLDVVILGVGFDGHFASIFPGWLEKSRIFYEEGGTAMLSETEAFDVKERMTLTAEIIKKARKILIVMKGKEKLPVLEEMMRGSKSPEEFPVKFLTDNAGKEQVQIFYYE